MVSPEQDLHDSIVRKSTIRKFLVPSKRYMHLSWTTPHLIKTRVWLPDFYESYTVAKITQVIEVR